MAVRLRHHISEDLLEVHHLPRLPRALLPLYIIQTVSARLASPSRPLDVRRLRGLPAADEDDATLAPDEPLASLDLYRFLRGVWNSSVSLECGGGLRGEEDEEEEWRSAGIS